MTYADELRYDVFGNRTRARFGNGVVTTWSFDPLRVRLASLVTTLPAPAATKVQDLRYSYDPADNPTRIENALPPPPASSKLPGGSLVTFTYDGVDRLTRAAGKAPLAQGSSTTYDQTFAYSASHRLLNISRRRRQPTPREPFSTEKASREFRFSSLSRCCVGGRRMFLGSYWSQREESQEAAAARIASFLKTIGDYGEELATWYSKGKSRAAALRSPLALDVASIASKLHSNRRDGDRQPIPELGFRFTAWNGKKASISATVGSWNEHVRNAVILDVVMTPTLARARIARYSK